MIGTQYNIRFVLQTFDDRHHWREDFPATDQQNRPKWSCRGPTKPKYNPTVKRRTQGNLHDFPTVESHSLSKSMQQNLLSAWHEEKHGLL